MSGRQQGAVTFAPLGPQIDNGYEMGGSRIYPFSAGLAIQPPAYYSDYLGPATGLPVSVPAGGLPDTIGANGVAATGAEVEASANPFGRTSPLPWLLALGVGAFIVGHHLHYERGNG